MVLDSLAQVGVGVLNSAAKSGNSSNTKEQQWKDLTIFEAAQRLKTQETVIQQYNTDDNKNLISKTEYDAAEAALKQQQGQQGGMNPLSMLKNIPIIGKFLGGGDTQAV